MNIDKCFIFFLRHSLVPVIVDQQEYSVCVLGMSLMCLQCNDAIQPRHCHTITYCAEDEVCHLLTGNTLRTITKNILTMFSLLDCRTIANTCISLRKRIKRFIRSKLGRDEQSNSLVNLLIRIYHLEIFLYF